MLERLGFRRTSVAGLEFADYTSESWPLTPAGYRALVEQLPAILYVVEPHHLGHWHYVSPQVQGLLGFSPEDWLANSSLWQERLHPEDHDRLLREEAHAVHTGQAFDSEYRMIARDGRVVWFCDRSIITKKNRFNAPLMQGVMLDISEQKRAKAALERSEQQYRDIVENAVEGIFRTNSEGRILLANPALARMLAYDSPEQLLAQVRDLANQLYVDPGQRDEFIRRIEAKGKTERFECQVRRRDGARVWISKNARAVRDGSGRALYYEGTIEDVTERKRAELEREVIHEIIEAVSVTANLDEFLRNVHESIKKILCADNFFVALHDHASGTFTFPFYVDQQDPAPRPEKMSHTTTAYVFRTGQPLLSNQQVREHLIEEGEIELVGLPAAAWLGVPLKTAKETIGVLVVQSYDDPNAYSPRDLELLASVGSQVALAIERKHCEEALRANEARLRLLIDQLPATLWTTDGELCFTSVQGAGFAAMNLKPEELIGRSVETFFCDTGTAIQAHRRALAGETINFETHCGDRTYENHIEPLCSSGGSVVGTIGVALEATERRQFEKQIRQAEKMEAVEQLAGGIAHNFNNLLTVVHGCAELVKIETRPAEVRRRSEQILKATERCVSLTQQLLAFGRKQAWNSLQLDLNGVLANLEPMLRRLIGKDIELTVRRGNGLGRVKVDRSQIEQVILNLVVNAREAMPQGGQLTIETSAVNLDEAHARHHADGRPGQHVVLVVGDTGSGMDPKTLAHIFEPFFTTKKAGTGLGLSTVYGILKQHGGHILVCSEPGRGTTFKVFLPVASEDDPAELPGNAPPKLVQGSETILLVEDEQAVRKLTREFLGQIGYLVLEAPTGAEALEMAQSYSGEIDLLITDVTMPTMEGPDLTKQLLKLRPSMKVLYISGHIGHSIVYRDALDQSAALLPKPFTRGALAEKVRELLSPFHPVNQEVCGCMDTKP